MVYFIQKGPGLEFRVQKTVYKDRIRVDIREYYIDDDGESKPTRKGVSISADDLPKFLYALKELSQDLLATGDLLPED